MAHREAHPKDAFPDVWDATGDRVIARIPLAWPLAAAAGFLVLTGLVVTQWAPLAELDAAVSDHARGYGHAHPDGIEIQRRITDTAETAVFFGVGLAGAVVLLLVRRAYAAAGLVAAAFASAPAVWGALHALLHRTRPAAGFVTIDSNGFPSGHATNSATLALVAVLLVWPRVDAAGRALAACLASVFVAAIGVTRVTLLAHWPSDVLGGWLLTLTVVPLVARVVARLVDRSHRPVCRPTELPGGRRAGDSGDPSGGG